VYKTTDKNVSREQGVAMAPPHRHLDIPARFLLLTLSVTAFGRIEAQVPELVGDRPDQTESSDTVGVGYVQFEFGWTRSKYDAGGDVTSDAFPETLVRVGVADDIELRFTFDGHVWEEADNARREDGAGDLGIGLKWRLWEEAGRRPQTAVLAGTSIPAGQAPFSSERFDPSIRLACSHTLSETLSLGYNLAGLWTTEEDAAGDRDTTASVAYSTVLGIALSDRFGTFVEFFGARPTGAGTPAHSLDTGLTCLIAEHFQIDIVGGVGLSDAADDWFVGAGLVWRVPR
jgi:hypothetical protein